jgi:hypothetical protein
LVLELEAELRMEDVVGEVERGIEAARMSAEDKPTQQTFK